MPASATRSRIALIGCCLVQFVLNLNGSIVNSALPAIQHDFSVGLTTLQWVVSAYIVTLAGLLTALGSLSDRVGRRRTLLAGAAVLAAGSILCALSGDALMLIAGRVVQAVGAAALSAAGLAAASGIYTDRKARGAAVAWWAGVGTVALVAGPALGGVIVGAAGWRAVFWLSVGLCAVAAVLIVTTLAESRATAPGRFDVVGQVLVSTLLVAVSVALIEGPRQGWGSAIVVGAGAVAMIALVALVLHVRRAANPIIPPALFANVPFVAASASALLGFATAGAMFFALPLYLQSVRGLSPVDAAFTMLPLAGAALIAAIVSGWIVDRGRSRFDLVLAGCLLALGALGIALGSGSLPTLIAASVAFGAGYGLLGDPLSVSALSALPEAEAGLASALFSTGKQFGQLLGIALVGIVLGSAAGDLAPHFERSGSELWILLAVCGVGVAAVNLFVRPRHAAARAAAS